MNIFRHTRMIQFAIVIGAVAFIALIFVSLAGH